MKVRKTPGFGSAPLNEWLDCATSFCELVKTLNPEGVSGTAGWVDKLPDGLHPDGETFLRAAGVATERFSRIAEAYVRDLETSPFRVLTFSVEAGDVHMDSEVALLRIQNLPNSERDQPTRVTFVPIGLKQRMGEPLLFGAEARIALFTPILDSGDIKPGVRLTYEVSGQQALKVFASVLQRAEVQPIWKAVGGFDVETSIDLTKDDTTDSIQEEWSTSNDPAGNRLLKFCRKASRLSGEETRHWPPYLRLTCLLNATNTDDDLELYFAAICAHTMGMKGPSGGWAERLETPEARALLAHTPLLD